ncbi:MAG: T9SS type A sorting domain-containing protein [candidate division WOR-3 bacterium]
MPKYLLLCLWLPVTLALATGYQMPAYQKDGWEPIYPITSDGVAQYMGYGYQHTVATDTGGNVHVVWYDNTTGTNQVYYRKWTRSSGSWGPRTQITNQTQPVYRPAVACDYSGNVHVVWYHSSGTGTYGIWYKRWSIATGTWGDSLQLYYPGGNYLNYYPSIACRPGHDNVHVAWQSRDAVNTTYYQVRHVEYTPGVGWGTPTVVSTNTGIYHYDVGVAVDSFDNVYVTWRSYTYPTPGTNYQVHMRSRISGTWGEIEQVSNTNPNADMYSPAVAVDADGARVHVVWDGDPPGNANDRVYYRCKSGGTWGNTDTVSIYGDGIQYNPTVAVRHDNSVHVVWRGYTQSSPTRHQIQHRCKVGNTWSGVAELTARTSGASGIQNPSLACDNRDGVHIVWYDDSDGDNDVYYIRGLASDVGLVSILAPVGQVRVNTPVTPRGRWRNYGSSPVDFMAYCFLLNPTGSRVYSESIAVTGLGPGAETSLAFPSYVVADTGTWTARCSTYAQLDLNPGNNTGSGNFRVFASGNVQMFQIQSPQGTYDTNAVVTPQGRWRNRTGEPIDFTAYFILINPSGTRVYRESLNVTGLAGHGDITLNFPSFNLGTAAGQWVAFCSTFSNADTFPADDTLSDGFTVEARVWWPYGWHEVKPMPTLPSGRAVKDGGWLVQMRLQGVRYIFAAKGNKVGDFYRYEPLGDTWTPLCTIPRGIEGKPPRRGAAATANAPYIYATKGNNTLGFWRYDAELDSWQQLPDVPLGISGKRVKGGTDMVFIRQPFDTGYVYLLKGYKNEFYRFNTVAARWDTMAPAPMPAGTGSKWDRGSWILYRRQPAQGLYRIFAHKARYHELWIYDVLADTWTSQPLPGMPFLSRTGTSKKSKDGGSAVFYGDFIYALKGGSTNEFWRYDILLNIWEESDSMPTYGSTGKRKKVKDGADIVVYQGNVFFALKGNKTCELWRYVVPDTLMGQENGEGGRRNAESGERNGEGGREWLRVGQNPVQGRLLTISYSLSPDHGPALVQVFDVAGRSLVQKALAPSRQGVAFLDLRRLSAGVYLLKVEARGHQATHKLVVE